MTIGDNIYDVTFRSDYDGTIYASLYNMLGQQLGVKLLEKDGDVFKVRLNLSAASSGVYLVRVGGTSTTAYQTGRIIVR